MNCYRHGRLALDYKQFGSGRKAIISFHGFGRNADDWKVFHDVLGQSWRMYSFQLFYHGRDYELDPYSPLAFSEWSDYLDTFCREMEIQEVVLLGYSMGGRLILGSLERLRTPIRAVVLLAPDGIVPNNWYRFVSATRIGRTIFKHIMRSPGSYLGIARALSTVGLVPEHRYRLFADNAALPSQRHRLLNTWLFLSKLMKPAEASTSMIEDKGLTDSFFVVAGSRDRVITLKGLKAWPFLIKNPTNLHVLDKGHRLMTIDVAKYVRTNLLP